MNIEYEATFANIDKDEVRNMLANAGARLVHPEFLMKRAVFAPAEGCTVSDSWLRVRDEGDRITMSIKAVDGEAIHNQKEIMLTVDSFEEAKKFLLSIGCREKSYQETRRECWELDGAEITIDEWPFLEPFVEVEAASAEVVRVAAERAGFDYNKARFCAADILYSEKYHLSLDRIDNQTPRIVFEMENPFVK